MLKRGIRVSGFFIFGLPGESRKTVKNTMDFISNLPLTYADFKVATPFPGTPLFEMAKEKEWIKEMKIEHYTSTTPSMQINKEIDSEFLEESTNQAYRSFYMRPEKIITELFSDSFIPLLLTHLSR